MFVKDQKDIICQCSRASLRLGMRSGIFPTPMMQDTGLCPSKCRLGGVFVTK